MTRAFPAEGLLAKKETQAASLHSKGILGKGTRVAILDTVGPKHNLSPLRSNSSCGERVSIQLRLV